MTEFGKSPLLSFQELSDSDTEIVIFPMSAFRVSMKASDEFFARSEKARKHNRVGSTECRLVRSFMSSSITTRLPRAGTTVKSLNRLNVSDSRVRENRPMSNETKPDYSPGLAGVIAGETAICWVDPNAGLMYRGYDIHEVAQKASYEEVAYLLLNGELPSTKQLAEFGQQIAAERTLPAPVVEMLRLLPRSTHPMDMLRTGVSMLSAFDPS